MKHLRKELVVMPLVLALSSCGGGGKSSPAVVQSNSVPATGPSSASASKSSSASLPSEIGGGAETSVEYSAARYISLGKFLLRGNYLAPRDTIPQAPRTKGVNTLFGGDPDYLPTDYVQREACWDGSGKFCYHTGIDYRAAIGTPVYSPVDGVVISDTGGTLGKVTILDDASNKYLTLLHLSEINVAKGDRVSVGCKLGLSGDTGVAGAPHLHAEERNSSGVLGWFGTKAGLNDAGAISPLTLLDQYGVDSSTAQNGVGLGSTTESCAKASTKSSAASSSQKSSSSSSAALSSAKSSLSKSSASSVAPKPIQTCAGLNGTTYSVGESEFNVTSCPVGQEGYISQMRTCASGVEFGQWGEWQTSGNFCTKIPDPKPPVTPVISGVAAYNFNSTTKVLEVGIRSYNNIVVVVTGADLLQTTVVDIPGLKCNSLAPMTAGALGNIGYASAGAYSYTGADGSTKYNYPTASPTSAIVSICLGQSLPVGTTLTISAKNVSGGTTQKTADFKVK